jgi:hypothetical protein
VTNAAQVAGMTEFPQDLRHYCRNPRCRSKLPSPVSNPREAFCTRGCYESFHLKRCRVCEQPLEAKYRKIKNGGDRTKFVRVQNSAQTCGSAECKRRWRERDCTGRFSAPKQAYGYQGSQKSNLRKETPVPQALFCAIQTPKWRQVAGPPLTPNQFHCATVADGPDGKWKDGGFERIEAKNRAALKAADQAEIEANGEFTEPGWREVISPDGVRCFVTQFSDVLIAPEIDAERVKALIEQIPDDLSIPDFLKREPVAFSESPDGLLVAAE